MRAVIVVTMILTTHAAVAQLKPRKIATLPNAVRETSGLACMDSNGVWTMNDSGNSPTLYHLNTRGMLDDSLPLPHALNHDWEDLAYANGRLYIGDIGNNLQQRRNQKIYSITRLDLQRRNNLHVDSISFTMRDEPPQFPLRRNRNFDCEALFGMHGQLYIISKNVKPCGKSYGKLYRLPATPGTYVAALLDSFSFNEPITAADYDSANKRLVVIGYLSCFVFDGVDDEKMFHVPMRRYRFNRLRQYEGCAYRTDRKRLYISNEKGFGKRNALFDVPMEKLTEHSSRGGPGYIVRRLKLSVGLWVYNRLMEKWVRQSKK